MSHADPTKARLIEAAGEEFAEMGFSGATVRRICKRAGANVAAVNYHFGDKEQLYVQAVMEAHRCGMEPLPQEAVGDGPAPARLRQFIRHFLANVLAMDQVRSWHHSLMLREMIQPSEACELMVREAIRPKFQTLRAILTELVPGADDRRLDAIAFSVIGQCLHYRVGREIATRLIGRPRFESLDLDYLTDHITGLTLAALGVSPPIDAAGQWPGADDEEPVAPGGRQGGER